MYDYDSEKPLPKGCRIVHRYVGGSFLIALKSGYYNDIVGTYDGRHNNVSPDDFLEYVKFLNFSLETIFDKERKKIPVTDLSDFELKSRILSLDLFNKNPFVQKEEENHSPKENPLKKEQFIIGNASSWQFSDLLPKKQNVTSGAKFYFTFSESSISSFEVPTRFYLNKNGNFISYKQLFETPPLDEVFFVYDRDQSKELKKQITEKINQYLHRAGFEPLGISEFTLNIGVRKNTTPKRLFSKDELKSTVQGADDRVSNILVIDENGYAVIVQEDENLYPVRNSIWQAGNNYAGKYSDLGHLDEDYSLILCAWLDYLKTGEHRYTSNCVIQVSDEEMVNEIKQICGIS